jgi:hypothetical protein
MHVIRKGTFNQAQLNIDYLYDYIEREIACKFRFKTGKEVYGIILLRYDKGSCEPQYFFMSAAENMVNHQLWEDLTYCKSHAQKIMIEDIVCAEALKLAA